jgi:transposase
MINRRISEDLKECALRLLNHGWDVEDVCEAFGVSTSSCYRWRQVLEERGTIKRPPSPLTGHTRTITRALLSAIQDLFAIDADLFLDEDEVCTWRAFEHNNNISLSTLSRTLEQAGLSRKILQQLAAERDDIHREVDAGSLLANVSAEPMEDAFFQ